MRTIAIFGVSGVGKTTLIRQFIGDGREYAHLQAGTLIKRALKTIPRDQLRVATPDQIIKNQFLLIDEFWKEIEEYKYSTVIFDGHSIVDNNQEIIKIPTNVIKGLKPQEIIFVEDEPKYIHERRTGDQSRQRADISIAEIEKHQDLAKRQAESYAHEIGIPFGAVKAGNLDTLKLLIEGENAPPPKGLKD